MPQYAIIRHQKVKHGRHLLATGMHNMRGAPAHNADPEAEPVKVLVGSHKPWRDVRDALHRMGIKQVRKDGNVAFEIVLATSPEYWTDRGWTPGIKPDAELQAAIDEWAQANLAYLQKRFGELLVSVVLHMDERSPHLHALAVCAQYRADGRARGAGKGVKAWRLSAEQTIKGPSHLKSIVTEYAATMARFGLARGEDRETGSVQHQPLRVWQEEQARRSEVVGSLIVEQMKVTQAAVASSEGIVAEAEAKAARILAEADKAKAEAEAERRQVEAEKLEVITLKERLSELLALGERLLGPILRMAGEWKRGSSMIRQALGAQGTAAVGIAESVEVQTLMRMRGKGSGR